MCQKDYLIEQMKVEKLKEFEQFKLQKFEEIQQKEKILLNRINKAKEMDKNFFRTKYFYTRISSSCY